MNSNQENIVKLLVENSKKINSRVFNLTKCIILALTLHIKDGLQYRELKTLLNVSDGKLQADLESLREMGYIQKIKVDLDNKKITIYMITDSGKNEIDKIGSWVELIQKLVRNDNV